MGMFSFFKKSKKTKNETQASAIYALFQEAMASATENYKAAMASSTTNKVMEEDEQKNGKKTKRNVVFQPEHITIRARRAIMTKGYPGNYYFFGDEHNKSGTLPLLSPLKIDVEKAVKKGIPRKNDWEPSNCILVAENDEYRFYNYGCYNDGSGGCTIGQKKSNPDQVLFFGKAGVYTCIFHNKLVQVDSSAYGTDFFLFFKDISSGKELICPWFGKYAIPYATGSRYDQDSVLSMKVDAESDSIIIEASRKFYINPSPDDNEALCNADTNYIMTVKAIGDGFQATADFPELNISVIFSCNA